MEARAAAGALGARGGRGDHEACTSAFLTLEALPVLHTIWRARQLESVQRPRVAIEGIVASPK